MYGPRVTASKMFENASKFMDAYYTVIKPLCAETALPPNAVDILIFIANNPQNRTAGEICRMRGLKPGIVSFHVERLVSAGFLERSAVFGDRRKTMLSCTDKAMDIIKKGKELQKKFAEKLVCGLTKDDVDHLQACFSTFAKNIDDIIKNGVDN